jgi:hypothetical protein
MSTWKDEIDAVVSSTLATLRDETNSFVFGMAGKQTPEGSWPNTQPAADLLTQALAKDPEFTGPGYPIAAPGQVPGQDSTATAGGHLFLPAADSLPNDWQPTTVLYDPPATWLAEQWGSKMAASAVQAMFDKYRLAPFRRVVASLASHAPLSPIPPGLHVVQPPAQIDPSKWHRTGEPDQSGAPDQGAGDTGAEAPAEASSGTWWKVLIVVGAAAGVGLIATRALSKRNPTATFPSPRQAGAAAEEINRRMGRPVALVQQVDERTWNVVAADLTDIEMESIIEKFHSVSPRWNDIRWRLIDESPNDANTRAIIVSTEKTLDPNVTAWLNSDLNRMRQIFGQPTRFEHRLRWLLHSRYGNAEITGFGEVPTLFALHLDRGLRTEHRNSILSWLERKGIDWQWAQGARAWY